VVANITMVQRATADQVRGRAFTLLVSATNFVLGLAFIAAGPLTNAIGARWVYAVAAGTIAFGAVVAWQLVRGTELELRPVPV